MRGTQELPFQNRDEAELEFGTSSRPDASNFNSNSHSQYFSNYETELAEQDFERDLEQALFESTRDQRIAPDQYQR